jgi:hypothetical protein
MLVRASSFYSVVCSIVPLFPIHHLPLSLALITAFFVVARTLVTSTGYVYI